MNHSCADVAQNFHRSTYVCPLLMQTIQSVVNRLSFAQLGDSTGAFPVFASSPQSGNTHAHIQTHPLD